MWRYFLLKKYVALGIVSKNMSGVHPKDVCDQNQQQQSSSVDAQHDKYGSTCEQNQERQSSSVDLHYEEFGSSGDINRQRQKSSVGLKDEQYGSSDDQNQQQQTFSIDPDAKKHDAQKQQMQATSDGPHHEQYGSSGEQNQELLRSSDDPQIEQHNSSGGQNQQQQSCSKEPDVNKLGTPSDQNQRKQSSSDDPHHDKYGSSGDQTQQQSSSDDPQLEQYARSDEQNQQKQSMSYDPHHEQYGSSGDQTQQQQSSSDDPQLEQYARSDEQNQQKQSMSYDPHHEQYGSSGDQTQQQQSSSDDPQLEQYARSNEQNQQKQSRSDDPHHEQYGSPGNQSQQESWSDNPHHEQHDSFGGQNQKQYGIFNEPSQQKDDSSLYQDMHIHQGPQRPTPQRYNGSGDKHLSSGSHDLNKHDIDSEADEQCVDEFGQDGLYNIGQDFDLNGGLPSTHLQISQNQRSEAAREDLEQNSQTNSNKNGNKMLSMAQSEGEKNSMDMDEISQKTQLIQFDGSGVLKGPISKHSDETENHNPQTNSTDGDDLLHFAEGNEELRYGDTDSISQTTQLRQPNDRNVLKRHISQGNEGAFDHNPHTKSITEGQGEMKSVEMDNDLQTRQLRQPNDSIFLKGLITHRSAPPMRNAMGTPFDSDNNWDNDLPIICLEQRNRDAIVENNDMTVENVEVHTVPEDAQRTLKAVCDDTKADTELDDMSKEIDAANVDVPTDGTDDRAPDNVTLHRSQHQGKFRWNISFLWINHHWEGLLLYKCKIQKNWCTVTVAPTIEHYGGHSRTHANQRWDHVPGRSQRLLLG